jgi:hypothetical protein
MIRYRISKGIQRTCPHSGIFLMIHEMLVVKSDMSWARDVHGHDPVKVASDCRKKKKNQGHVAVIVRTVLV